MTSPPVTISMEDARMAANIVRREYVDLSDRLRAAIDKARAGERKKSDAERYGPLGLD